VRIQPRQQILDVWRSLLAASYSDGTWTWGGRDEPNSISDAEQLLCLLHPMNEIEAFYLHDPDSIRSDVGNALKALGSVTRIPRAIVDIATDYFARHTDEDKQPSFTGGSYFKPETVGGPEATDEQRGSIDVVDSYSLSLTLCLAVLSFVKAREPLEGTSNEYGKKLVALRESASLRLTAAMIGLLRSFVVHSVTPESPPGQAILSMLRKSDVSVTDSELQRRLRDRFSQLRAQLRDDVRLAVDEDVKPDRDQLFECGWTWGIAEKSRQITDSAPLKIATADGAALSRPYLYFTVIALDGIVDLYGPRTRALNLLDDEQRRLAEALNVRWEVTQKYWSAVARFDPEQWPLEDIPWRTSDGEESDYYSLLVISVLIQDLVSRTATEADLLKAVDILEELARRGRITRRVMANDPALVMHSPGVRTRLNGTGQSGPDLAWFTYDYAPLLLKRVFQAIRLTADVEARERLMVIAESTMEHLHGRRLIDGKGAGLWDDASRLRPGSGVKRESAPSWYLTERVVEALVVTASAYAQDPPRSPQMLDHLVPLLNEADHLYNQELLEADADDHSALRSGLDQIASLIARARDLQNQRISTAVALAEEALRLLDELAQARADAERGR